MVVKRGNRNNTGKPMSRYDKKCPISPLIVLQRIRGSGEIKNFDLDKKYLAVALDFS